MELKIGNWMITENVIKWDGKPETGYEIPIDRLLESGMGNRNNIYDWLVHMPEKTWLTESDIYALNTAFILVFSKKEFDFNTCSFFDTLIMQQKILKGED